MATPMGLDESTKPRFPIRVVFPDGDEWVLDNLEELICSVEEFGAADGAEGTRVLDADGREVELQIEPPFELQVFRVERK